jgi:hypothetical protein
MAVAPWIVSEELWELVEPLLPKAERRFAIRVGGGCPIVRRCRGSCSCCIPGSRGRICRSSSASVRE